MSDPPRRVLDLQALFDVLDRHRVDYLVIGGFAVGVHGHPRATGDLDVTADLAGDNLRRLAAALEELGAELRGVGDLPHDLSPLRPEDLALGGKWTLATEAGHLDVLNSPSGAAPYADLRARSVAVDYEGNSVPIVGLDDLVAMKLAAGRPKDLDDLTVLGRRHPWLRLDLDELQERRQEVVAAAPDAVPNDSGQGADPRGRRRRSRWWERRPR